jgi:hypothetical protein
MDPARSTRIAADADGDGEAGDPEGAAVCGGEDGWIKPDGLAVEVVPHAATRAPAARMVRDRRRMVGISMAG